MGAGAEAEAELGLELELVPLCAERCERTIGLLANAIVCLAQVGDFVAAASGPCIHVYVPLGGWDEVCVLQEHKAAVVALKGHEDKLISASPDRTIRIWSSVTWTCVNVLHTEKASICTMAIFDDLLVTGSDDGALKTWDVRGWSHRSTVAAHSHVIWAITRLGRDRIITGSSDRLIKVWRARSSSSRNGFDLEQTLEGHQDEVQALAVDSERNWLLSGADDVTIFIHDTMSWTVVRKIVLENRAVLSLLSYGRHIIFGLGNGQVIIFDKDQIVNEGKPERSLTGHSNCVMAFLALEGRLVTASFDCTIKVWGP